jgi:thiamine pyrophosphate-dependent acetolactate synthase large subunit-like protein
MFSVSGGMASMACGVPYAIAAALAYPGRQVIAFVGDGGLAMLLGELATITRYKLKNNELGQIKWEQMMFLGNPEYECDLQPIDFAKVAEAMGIRGYRLDDPKECAAVLDAALAEEGATLVEALVDPNEPFLPPKRNEQYTRNLEHALEKGTPRRREIERALNEEPARMLLED